MKLAKKAFNYIQLYTGWWYTYPSWKIMEFDSWDDDIPI